MQDRDDRPANHHIWNNNGTYFIHVTLLWNGQKKMRLRKSLQTKDVVEARRRRDGVLRMMQRSTEMTLLAR